MNILTPFSSVEQMKAFINLGVKELFCGYIPASWINAFNIDKQLPFLSVPLNKRANIKANITSEQELRTAINIAKQNNVKLFLTINALYFPDPMWNYLKQYLNDIQLLGIENCIVTDYALMDYITKNTNLDITASCLCNVTNTAQVNFLKQFRITRVVFPRHISKETLVQICQQHPDIEFEYFILSDKCIYNDGNCHCNHNIGAFCNEMWNTEYYPLSVRELDESQEIELQNNEYLFKRWSTNRCAVDKNKFRWRSIGCSLCSLATTISIPNISSLKIVGRGFGTEGLKQMIEIVNKAIQIAQDGDTALLCDFARNEFNNEDMCSDYHYCIVR